MSEQGGKVLQFDFEKLNNARQRRVANFMYKNLFFVSLVINALFIIYLATAK